MSRPYLEITYRKGKPFAAYLYLDRLPGDKSLHTEKHGQWLVDFGTDGRAIGVEFPSVGTIDLAELNRVLIDGKQPELEIADLIPLQAA